MNNNCLLAEEKLEGLWHESKQPQPFKTNSYTVEGILTHSDTLCY